MKRSPLALLVGACALGLGACNDSTSPSSNHADPSLAKLGSLAVGQVRALTFADATDGLVIPAELASAQYLIVAANLNVSSGMVSQYTVTGDWLTSNDTPKPAATQLPALGAPSFTTIGGRRGGAFEERLRAYERRRLSRSMARSGAAALLRMQRQVPKPALAVVPAVGASMTINTLDPVTFNNGGDVCADPLSTVGTVQAVSRHAIVVRDNRLAAVTGGFTQTDYQNIATEFDQKIFPTDSAYFGNPTDIDGNTQHVILYYTPSVNLLTPAGHASTGGYVGGFFFAGDLFDTEECAQSNQGEIFYLLAPDPGATFGNMFATADVRTVTRGTVAHEFQHMINAGNRFLNPAAADFGFESSWLDEGLAHTAEDAVGRAETNIGALSPISMTTVSAMSEDVYFAFFAQNFGRATSYVERPDTTGAIVGQLQSQSNLASRGAVWAMLRYAADWFSGDDPRVLMRALAVGPDTGTSNLVRSVGVPMDTLLGRWLVTLYTDHNSAIAGLDPRYNYKSYTLRDILLHGVTTDNEPASAYLGVRAIGSAAGAMTIDIPSSSAAYFVTNLTTGTERTVRIVANGSVGVPDPKGRLYVVRLR